MRNIIHASDMQNKKSLETSALEVTRGRRRLSRVQTISHCLLARPLRPSRWTLGSAIRRRLPHHRFKSSSKGIPMIAYPSSNYIRIQYPPVAFCTRCSSLGSRHLSCRTILLYRIDDTVKTPRSIRRFFAYILISNGSIRLSKCRIITT